MVKKISLIIMKVILSCASIWLMFMAYVGGGDITGIAITVAVMWLIALNIDEGPNMIWRLLKMEQKIDLNKFALYAFFLVFVSIFVMGFFYKGFYPEKVAMRQQHLFSTVNAMTVPGEAEKVAEEHFIRSFAQTYYVKYECTMNPEAIRQHYVKEAQRRGYKARYIDSDIVDIKNGDVIVTVTVGDDKISLFARFDDFFERWSI